MSIIIDTSTSQYATAYSNQRKLVKTSTDKLVLFANVDDEIKYKISSDDGDTWGSWILAFSGYAVTSFDIHIDTNNDVLLVMHENGIKFRKLTYSVGTWSNGTVSTVHTSQYREPKVNRRSNGDIAIGASFGSIQTYILLKYSVDEGATWGSDLGGNYSYYTMGNAMVAYDDQIWIFTSILGGSPLTQNLQLYKYENAFVSSVIISTNILGSENIKGISALKISDNNIWVSARTSSGIKIFHWNGSVWDSGTLISDNANDESISLMNYNNNPVAIWRDYNGSQYDIVYREYNGSSWESQISITTDATSDDYPSALESDSDLYLIWTKGDSSPYDIYFGKIAFTTEVISDINNDFRSLKLFALDDINNDFRMVSTLTYYDILNDFRLTGATLENINNDFRLLADDTVRIDINNHFRFVLEPLNNINNKFNLSSLQLYDINNKFNLVKEPTLADISNIFNLVDQTLPDINNDIRTQKLEVNNINNDFRMIADWQIPGDIGFQSLGKTYIKVYIDSVEQTDADINSISIAKILNGTHTTVFDLGRAYDSTKPDIEAVVEIKYKNWVIYKGYIIDIAPTDSPESIRISCNDKYWKQNKTNKYFFIGHKPQDNKEKYYNTINEGLSSECSFNTDIGNFIPQTMDSFGQGESDCISALIQNAGNLGWFYKEDESKKLWEGGKGDIIDIEAQSIGKNIGLHQIIRHQFRETIEGLVNKFRVQMGETTIRRFTHTHSSYWTEYYWIYASPTWNSSLEQLAKNSSTWYGWDYPEPDAGDKYKDVFRKYNLFALNPEIEAYSDKYPPEVEINTGHEGYLWTPDGFGADGKILEGFTIDYENEVITFNKSIFLCKKNTLDEISAVKRVSIKLKLWKNKYFTYTTYIGEDPETEIGNPLMFFTDKIGTYSETIMKVLDLSSLSIQQGATWIDNKDVKHEIISWDDTEFAKNYANWQLSKTADKKITGSIDITLDSFLFYNIDLSKRIMINGVIDNPLNITSINIDISNFMVTLGLESYREFKRSVSLPGRGE